jgi:hypothetical protein
MHCNRSLQINKILCLPINEKKNPIKLVVAIVVVVVELMTFLKFNGVGYSEEVCCSED